MTLLGRLFQPSEQRAVYSDDVWGSGGSPGGSTSSGVPVSNAGSLRLISVWACVRLIAESIASLPTDAYVRKGGQRVAFTKPQWMWRPNPEQTAMQFWEQVLTSMLLYGNAYIYIVRAPDTTVLELWVLHPDNVDPRRDGANRSLIYHATDDLGNHYALTKDVDILHIPAFSLPGEIKGLNPIAHAKQAIGLGLAAEDFGSRYFSQGSTMNVVLESDKALDDTMAKRVAKSWRRSHTGLKNSHFPAILEGGIKAKPLTIPNDQAQFLESRQFSVVEIARFYRVPPHLIGEVTTSTSWGTGIEEQSIGFVVNTLRTWMERIEQAVPVLFPPESRAFMKFNAEGLLRGNVKARYDGYAVALQNGFKNIDEVRALEDDPPLPDGKGAEFIRPLNFGPVGEPQQDPANKPDPEGTAA